MVGVDEYRVGDRVVEVVDERADLVDVLVDRDGDDLEVVVSEFVLECLPTWQIEDASSPTGERDEEPLLRAVIGE